VAIKASGGLKDFIRSKESFKPTPYKDVTGKMTVGYGDTSGSMTTISEEEANQRLADRLVESENAINKFVNRKDLTQEQQDVLLDMEYNIGITKLRRQGFIDLVNNGTHDEIGRAILNFSRAKDEKTGVMKEFPGLKKRSEERAKMWGYTGMQPIGVATPDMQGMQNAVKEGPSDPFADFSSFQPANNSLSDFKDFRPKEAEPFSDFKTFQPQGKTPVDPTKEATTDLSITGQAFDGKEVQARREAKKLAKDENIPFDEAEALIFEKHPNQVRLEKNQDDIAKYFPVTAKWAKDMDNYELLRDKTKSVVRIETSAKAVNPSFIDDFTKSVKSGMLPLEEAYAITETLLNARDTKSLEKKLREIEDYRNRNGIEKYKDEKGKLAKSFSELEKSFGKLGDVAGSSWDNIYNNGGSFYAGLKATFDGSVEAADKILDTIRVAAENPEALALMGAEQSGSFATSVSGGLVGGATGLAVAGPIGAAIGAKIGAGSSTALLSFGSYMREQLDEFRDPITGLLMVDQAFSNPDTVAKWTKMAATYGITMGVIDGIFTGMAGKSLVKPVQGNSFLKKAISKSVDLAKGTAVQAAGEGIGETGATITALAVGGELTTEKAGQAVGKGVTEAIASIVPGAATDIVGAGARRTADWVTNAKESISKTNDRMKKSNAANSAYNNLQTIREHIDADPSILENPEAIIDLINKAASPQKEEAVSNEPFNEDALNSAVEAEIKDIKDETSNVITIYPSEWDSFTRSTGLDPADAIRGLGLQVAQQYATNKEADSSIDIPVGDWIVGTKDMPEADAIARVNGNEYNAVEGGKIVEDLEKDPFTYFDQSAFHGSPYKFDKFSTEKIGTGEGAQAFGYGLYFTEDKDIAEYYRKTLSERKDAGRFTPEVNIMTTNEIARRLENEMTLPENAALLEKIYEDTYSEVENGNFTSMYFAYDDYEDFKKTFSVKNLISEMFNRDWGNRTKFKDIKNPFQLGYETNIELTDPMKEIVQKFLDESGDQIPGIIGQTYEVKVPEKEQMLDWDVTFSGQSEYVKGKLEPVINEINIPDSDVDYLTGQGLYKALSRKLGGDKNASNFLNSNGISGIKYAAQGGKSEKKNFVVFSDKDVSIAQTFYQQDGNLPPVIPGQEGEEFIPPVGDFSGEPVLRPVELYDRFRNDTEKKVFKKILSQLRDSTSWAKGVPKESLDIVAELQYRHTKARAEMLGKTIDEVANMATIGMTSKTGTRGLFGRQASFWQPYRIAFNRTADAATIVHELGHSWLHEMSEDWTFISNMPEDQLDTRQREYKEVMQIAAKELGLGTMDQLYNRSKEEVTHIHERFSQTTEKYFLEGKFADSRVKKMLEFFRQWMTKIAHIVGKTYPEHPGLEITPQVERIFNALLDADNKVKEELYPMFAEPMFPEGFLGKDQAKYLDTVQDARSEAIAELYGKMLKAPLKEREAMINKALDEFYKEAEEDIAKLPSMRLLKDMENYYGMYKRKELDADPRISFESFKKLLAEDRDTKAIELRATLPEKMISTKGKGGVDIELVMQQMGITDPNEMLNVLKQAGQKEQLINDRVGELIDKNFPALKTDKEIHDIAVESLNKVGKEKIIQKEFNILLDKYRPQIKVLIERGMLPAGLLGSKEAKKIIEAKADEILLDAPIGGFNFRRFLADSDKHGRQAAKSFKEGNVVYSFEEKYKQSIQFSAYKKAIDLLKPLAETKVLANSFEKIAMDPAKAKTYDIDAMTYGVQIINMFRSGLTALPLLDISAFSDRSGISEDHVELINKQIQDMAIAAKGRGGRTTSVRTYLEFGAILKSLMKVARDAKKVEIGGQRLDREQFIGKLLAEVGPRLSKDTPITEREAIQNILMGLRPVRSELSSLFKSDIDFEKSALGTIYNEITKAEAIRNEKLDVQRAKVVNAVKEATKSDSILSAIVRPITTLVGSTILNKPPKPVRMKSLGITLDHKAELYMFLLYLGSESGSEKLLRGGVKGSGPLAGYNIETNELDTSKVQADIDALIADGTLTKKDFDMLQTVWDAFDAFHPDAAKAIRATDGRNIGYVKGKAVKTPWGDYRGGYVPITSDTYLKQQSLESMRSPDNAMYKSNDFYPNMDMSFTKTRDRQFYDVNLDFSRITAKLSGVANVAYLREPLMNIGKVLGNPTVMNTIEDRRPGFYESSLIPWFDRTKLQQYSEPSREFHNKFAKMLRSNANLKFYFGNVLSGVKQYIGLTNAIPLVGAGNISIAAGRFVTAPKASINFISSMDPRMKQMFESHHINQIKSFENLELNFDWVDTSKDKLNQMAFFVIQSMQSHVSAIVWMAGYDKALKEGLTEKQAINYATNAVKNSQGSTTVSDMARVQFGTDAWKLFTMFSMVPITGGSELYKSYMRTGDTKSSTARASLRFAAVMGAGVFTFMAPTVLEAIVSEFGKGEKEDEEKKRKALLKDMAFNFADQSVPVYGRWIAKPLIYGQVSISPLVDNVTQDFGATKRGMEASQAGAEITAREFSGMMNMLTYGSGLPFTILGKAVKMDEMSMGKKEATRKAKRRKIILKKAKVKAKKKRTE